MVGRVAKKKYSGINLHGSADVLVAAAMNFTYGERIDIRGNDRFSGKSLGCIDRDILWSEVEIARDHFLESKAFHFTGGI